MIRNLNTMTMLGLLLLSTAGAVYSGMLYWQATQINHRLARGERIDADASPVLQKFSAAAFQSRNGDYKHAVQTYGQLLELRSQYQLTDVALAPVQYNIGNNLFQSALVRRQNDDGSIADEARYDLAQAKIAYEQALRLNPDYGPAKFNLSLLNSILSEASQAAAQGQAGVELSNIPIGLP